MKKDYFLFFHFVWEMKYLCSLANLNTTNPDYLASVSTKVEWFSPQLFIPVVLFGPLPESMGLIPGSILCTPPHFYPCNKLIKLEE